MKLQIRALPFVLLLLLPISTITIIPWTLFSFSTEVSIFLFHHSPPLLIHAFPFATLNLPRRQQQLHGTRDRNGATRRYALSSSELKTDGNNNNDDDDDNNNERTKKKKKTRRKKQKNGSTGSSSSSSSSSAASSSSSNDPDIDDDYFRKNSNIEDVSMRLKLAAARAAAKAKAKKEGKRQGGDYDDDEEDVSRLGTVHELFELIADLSSGAGSGSPVTKRSGGGLSFVEGIGNPWREDSITSLLSHNQAQEGKIYGGRKYHPSTASTTPTIAPPPDLYHVALVFSKSLIRDQITVEYSSRIQKLVQSIRDESYRPSLICFVASGDTIQSASGSNHNDNHHHRVQDTHAGYLYFLHLCASHGISIKGIDFYVQQQTKKHPPTVPPPPPSGRVEEEEQQQQQQPTQEKENTDTNDKSNNNDNPVLRCMKHVQREYLDGWLESSPVRESPTDEYGLKRRQPRKKVRIHFALFSTEYHLCNLNDIHRRSPRQSPLKPIDTLKQKMSKHHNHNNNKHDQNPNNNNNNPKRGIVDTSWTYRYCVYPFLYQSADPQVAFRAKCYLLGEELVPLLLNLRGVVNNEEFFQRDNYEALVSARSALVSDMEELYRSEPSLKSSLRCVPSNIPDRSMDIVVEGVLLALGRCQDLVRPAGLFVSSVPKPDWVVALDLIEGCLARIKEACDPDTILPPREWGKTPDDNDISRSSSDTEDEDEEEEEEEEEESRSSMTHWRKVKGIELD